MRNDSDGAEDELSDWAFAEQFDLGVIDTDLAERALTRLLEQPPSMPERIGRFEVIRLLAGGSYGWVFEGRDPHTERRVALKIPKLPNAADTAGRDSFLREARAARELAHPNIVTVLEVGEHENSFYIAYEFVDGPTLRSWLRDRESAVPFAMGATLVARLASAMSSVHAQGIAHRDLKLENILLASAISDEFGFAEGSKYWTPRITDFGLAALPEDVRATARLNARVGTLAYLPPEQLENPKNPPLQSGDVYAIGVILYELLVGRLPFQSDSVAGLTRQIIDREPVTPRSLRPDLPRDLETICLKCLQKYPSRRYASAAALADDLNRYLRGETIRARPVRRFERVVRWIKKKPVEAVASAIAAMAVMACIVAFGAYLQYRAYIDAQLKIGQWTHVHLIENGQLHAAATFLDQDMPERAYEVLENIDVVGPRAAPFSFGYLRHKAHRQLSLLEGHEQPIDAFAPIAHASGRRLVASASLGDHSIRLWDIQSEAQLAIRAADAAWLEATVDGRSFWSCDKAAATFGEVVTFQQLDALSLEPIGEPLRIDSLAGGVLATSLDDGRLLVVGTEQTSGSIWDPTIGNWTGQALFEGNPIRLVRATQGGTVAALVDVSARATYPSLPQRLGADLNFPVIQGWHLNPRENLELAVSADGSAFGCINNRAVTSCFIRDGAFHRNRPITLDPSPSGVLALSDDGTMHATACREFNLINVTRFEPVHNKRMRGSDHQRLNYGEFEPASIAFVPGGGDLLMRAVGDNRLWVWHTRPPEEEIPGKVEISDFAHVPGGSTVLTADSEGRLRAIDWQPGKEPREIKVFKFKDREVSAVAVDPRNQIVASGCWDESGDITLHDFKTLQPIRVLKGHAGPIRDLAFSPNSRYVASASKDCSVLLWDLKNNDSSSLMHKFANRARCVSFAPDGKTLIMAGQDGVLRGVDVATGKLEFEVVRDSGINAMAVSPNGARVVIGQENGELLIYERLTRALIRVAHAHNGKGGVMSLAFHPNGEELASGGADGCVSIRSAVTGWELIRERSHVGEVPTVQFSPDGSRLISVGRDGKVVDRTTD